MIDELDSRFKGARFGAVTDTPDKAVSWAGRRLLAELAVLFMGKQLAHGARHLYGRFCLGQGCGYASA